LIFGNRSPRHLSAKTNIAIVRRFLTVFVFNIVIFKKSKPRLTPITKTGAVKRLLELAPVKLGNSNRLVLVFFDFKCPFCARFFRETEELLVEMAEKGLIRYAICDYVVHRDAEVLHRALRCVPEGERLRYIRNVFNGGKVEVRECPEGILGECMKLAEEVGVYGTPTILFYDFAKDRGYIHFGYMTPGEVLESLSSL
jgi:protein-disulfide isomerase